MCCGNDNLNLFREGDLVKVGKADPVYISSIFGEEYFDEAGNELKDFRVIRLASNEEHEQYKNKGKDK